MCNNLFIFFSSPIRHTVFQVQIVRHLFYGHHLIVIFMNSSRMDPTFLSILKRTTTLTARFSSRFKQFKNVSEFHFLNIHQHLRIVSDRHDE